MSGGFEDFRIPGTSEEHTRFQEGYERIKNGDADWVDALWDPVDRRWETYSNSTFTQVAVAPVDVSYNAPYSIMREVFTIGEITRGINAQVIWWPKNGNWYQWRKNQIQGPPAPPPIPPWLRDMNSALDQIASDTSMTPEDKAEARLAIIQQYFGVARHA